MTAFVTSILALLVGIVASTDSEALFFAVRQDNGSLIQDELNKGADINYIGPGGQTPLMHAVLQGRETSTQFLLSKGADVTTGEKDGYTPMHGAGFQGRSVIAKQLLDHGLDPLIPHDDGFLPIHRSCWGREDRHTATVQVFLEAGVPFDIKSKDGKTCLDMTKNPATIELLEYRANL
jgi:ankyrin repeat protein